MTCRSWYIATLPHLHHTLTLRELALGSEHNNLRPLQELDEMQLLPFVRRLRILHTRFALSLPWFSPRIINARSLACFEFSALTNVQELGIDDLDLEAFIPQVRLYFGRFTPTLRYLALRTPRGGHNKLLYFLGLFQNLDDFKLIHHYTPRSQPSSSGSALIPESAPSLRGRLTLNSFGDDVFLRDLSKMCGGLRFRSMDLGKMEGARFLLDSCADTLETLRIYPGGQMVKGGHSQGLFV